MPKILTITFSEKSCHVNDDTQKSIAHDFEKMHELPKLIAELKSLYSSITKVKINIPANHSMVCDIIVERTLSEDEIILFLKSRASNLFGHSSNQLCIDYVIKNEIDDQQQTITAVAAHASLINDIQRIFSQAKILIEAIQINGRMNLLPWRENKKRECKKLIMINAFLIALLIIFIFCGLKLFLIHETKQLILTEKNNVNNEKKIILLHPHQNIILLKKLISLRKEKLNSMQKNKVTMLWLSVIANTLPNELTLTALVLNANEIILTGISNQLASIHTYADALRVTLKNKKVTLTEIHDDAQNKSLVHFTIQVTL